MAEEEQVIAVPPRVWIQQAINTALNQKPGGLGEFLQTLQADGVSVRFNQRDRTRRRHQFRIEQDRILWQQLRTKLYLAGITETGAPLMMTQIEMLKRFTAAAEALEEVVPELKSQIVMMASQASAESAKSPEPENRIQFPGLLQSLDRRMMALDETLTLLLQTTPEISAMKLSVSQIEKMALAT